MLEMKQNKLTMMQKTRKLTIRIGEGANATKGGIYTDKTPETTIEFKAKLGEKR